MSGILALLILYAGYFILFTRKAHGLGLAALDIIFLPQEYVISIFLISAALGLLGSFIAVGRFFEL
jgi:hypothetical protein